MKKAPVEHNTGAQQVLVFAFLSAHALYERLDPATVERQKEARHRPDKEHAHQRARPCCAAQQKAAQHEQRVHGDPDDTETPVLLFADDQRNKVVRPCPGIGTDDHRHPKGEDHTAGDEKADPHRKGRGIQKREQRAEEVDDRTSKGHAQGRADLDVAAVDKKQNREDQQADGDMYASVGQPGCAGQAREHSVQPLNQHVEGIGAEIGQQEQRYAQVRHAQSHKQDDDAKAPFFQASFRVPASFPFLLDYNRRRSL